VSPGGPAAEELITAVGLEPVLAGDADASHEIWGTPPENWGTAPDPRCGPAAIRSP